MRNDYDIFLALAQRLGFSEQYSENRTNEQWLAYSLEHSDVTDIEAFKRTGIYCGKEHQRSGLEEFRTDPLAHPLHTPSGKIELAPKGYALSGFSAVPTARLLAPDPAHPLRLITPVSPLRTHSQGSNIAWFRNREPGGIWMHPDDAAARHIDNGQMVEVYNPQGILRTNCRITADIMPGVVCMLHGVWPEFDANGVETAGSVNILTSTEGTLPSRSSRTHSIQVQVKVLAGENPENLLAEISPDRWAPCNESSAVSWQPLAGGVARPRSSRVDYFQDPSANER